jgi:hypothetical protein
MIYLLEIADLDHIEAQLEKSASALAVMFGREVSLLSELRFVQFSGLTYYVGDEIGLILSSAEGRSITRQRVVDFAQKWDFERWLNEPLLNLSDGWRKHLLQSLFIEGAPEGNILFIQALSHYLADGLIDITLRNIGTFRKTDTVLAEWDCHPILSCAAPLGLIEVVYDEQASPFAGASNGNLANEDRECRAFVSKRQLFLRATTGR